MESAVRSPRIKSAITTGRARNDALLASQDSQNSRQPTGIRPSKPCRGERNFWMERLEAKNRPERPQGSPETERVERYRRKSPQKRPIGCRGRDLRFRRTGWWCVQSDTNRSQFRELGKILGKKRKIFRICGSTGESPASMRVSHETPSQKILERIFH